MATPPKSGDNATDTWRVNAWVKKAILLYFPMQGMQTSHAGDIEFWDKIPTKKNYAAQKVRVVPPRTALASACVGPYV